MREKTWAKLNTITITKKAIILINILIRAKKLGLILATFILMTLANRKTILKVSKFYHIYLFNIEFKLTNN